MSVATDQTQGVHITSIQVKRNEDSTAQNNNSEDVKPQSDTATDAGVVNSHTTVSAAIKANSVGVQELLPTSADEVAPADTYWTTQRDQAVKLRMQSTGPASAQPITISTLLKHTVNKVPNGFAIAAKRNGQWVKWTYREYLADIRRAGKAFIKLGLEPFKGVGIIGFNSPEWFIADLGCILAGGLVAGIYTTNSPEACKYVALSSEANIIVVENDHQLQKILEVRAELPDLKAIVQYSGELKVQEDNVYSWQQFMAKGDEVSDEVLDERINALVPNRCCMLIYTSGTTGNPKGVMLSHDNITWVAETMKDDCLRHLDLRYGEVSGISYLPLSHVAAQLMDVFLSLSLGGTTYFAQPDALKGSLGDTLKEVQPHVFLGVPRVWEKMQERMQLQARTITGLKRRISRWAKGVGLRANYAIMNGESTPFGYGLADTLLFKRVRTLLGMERCKIRICGAAPVTKETLEFFMGINQPLCEVYGMSECCGPHTNAFPRINRICSVGKEISGVSTELANMDEDGNGEVVMFGRHVFMGYLGEEEKTKEALDDAGGLHSGDIGKKDKDGFMYITGRIKELIITAGGENIPPVPIEEAVKEALPVVSQCMLIGDKKRFLSMLITLKVDVDPDTQEPSQQLTGVAVDWVRAQGSNANTLTEILEPGDRAVLQAIQRGIDRVNSRATSNAQKIQKWSLLPQDFSIPGGELGPTMKMRRPIIHKMYANTIDAFYADPAPGSTSSPPSSPAADSVAPPSPAAVDPAPPAAEASADSTPAEPTDATPAESTPSAADSAPPPASDSAASDSAASAVAESS